MCVRAVCVCVLPSHFILGAILQLFGMYVRISLGHTGARPTQAISFVSAPYLPSVVLVFSLARAVQHSLSPVDREVTLVYTQHSRSSLLSMV